jgi:lipid A 3-O-deacylase
MKPVLLLILFLAVVKSLFAQHDRSFLYEVKLISENDNYALTYVDGYYTNGFFLNYTKLSSWKTNEKVRKIISNLTIGQKIFVSEDFYNNSTRTIDRPFSGYLFIEKGARFFYAKGHVLQTSLAAGATGKYSKAEEVQKWYHSITNLPEIYGWRYQLNGELSLNLSAKYDYNIRGIANDERLLEVMATGMINAGNAFTNMSAGTIIKFGNFENPLHSGFYSARVGNKKEQLKRKEEIFVYFNPLFVYQLYNATVEGPLFRQSKGPIVSDITKLFYMHSFGIHFSENRWTVDVHYTMKNKEATTMRSKEKFGSISLAYRFGKNKTGQY